jgi:APA family basic amino acid/polyamine antiporter
MIVALLSAVNSNVLMAPRVLFAMSRDRLFWKGAAEVNKGGTPDIALLFSSFLAAVFVISGKFEQVIAILAFFFVANYTLSFVSLFAMRRSAPDAPRPFRAIGHPYTTILALLASVAFLVGAVISDLRNSLFALGVLVLTIPLYLLVRRK